MAKESSIQADIISDVKASNGLACKLIPFNIIGIPDLLLALPGTGMFLVEVKKPGGVVSKIQAERHRWMTEVLGIKVFVIYSLIEWVKVRKSLLLT